MDAENKKIFDEIIEKKVALEKRIFELETENAELKAKNKWYSEQVCNKECAEVWGELTKAKEIIQDMLRDIPNRMWYSDETIKRAEAFLKE